MSATRKTAASPTIAERVAAVIAALPRVTPPAMQATCGSLLVDTAGLCLAARHSDFMRAMHSFTAVWKWRSPSSSWPTSVRAFPMAGRSRRRS